MSPRRIARRAPPIVLAGAAAFEAAPEAAALCRVDGRVVALNGAARRLFGRAPAAGFRLSDLVGGAGAAPLRTLAGRPPAACLARAAPPLEFSVRRLARGRSTPFAAYFRAGPTPGELGVRPTAEALLGRLAHELNNPLAILLAQATVLRDVAPDADVARRAERIATAAQRAGRVLADLLAVARSPAPHATRPPAERVGAPVPAALSVLVVDDEEDVAASLADLLALAGHAVTVETSPEAALERAARHRFDAVFADLRMPGLDGLALRDALAKVDSGLARRTVIVTGDPFPPGGGSGRDGTGPRLDKPFTMAGLRAVLDRIAAP